MGFEGAHTRSRLHSEVEMPIRSIESLHNEQRVSASRPPCESLGRVEYQSQKISRGGPNVIQTLQSNGRDRLFEQKIVV